MKDKFYEKIIENIMSVVIADNSKTAIESYLKTTLTKLYNEAFYQGTLNIIKKEYPKKIQELKD